MSYIELLQKSPGLFVLVLIISLVVTLLVYGAFPIIFAKLRKTPITKKKYNLLCYGINFIGVIFFVALNGAASGAPYILWTGVFSYHGAKILTKKELLLKAPTKREKTTDTEAAEETPPTFEASEEAPKEHEAEVEKVDKPKKPINKKLLITVSSITLAVITVVLLVFFVIIPQFEEKVPTEIIATFDSVDELRIAVKKDPTYYNGKRISIKGYADSLGPITYLSTKNESGEISSKIRVQITDDIKLSVLGDGDYIDLNGVVTIFNGEIRLDHCTYSMISTKEELEASKPQKTIKVAISFNFYPFEYESNGEYVGAHIDIAKEFAKRNNWGVTFVPVEEFEDIVPGVQNGTYDMALGICKTLVREEIVSFTDPYLFTDNPDDAHHAIFHSESFEEWTAYKTTFNNMISDGTIANILSQYDIGDF